MSFDKVDSVYLALAFLVPGFVMFSTISCFQPRKTPKENLTLLSYLTLSAWNYAFAAVPLFFITRQDFATIHPVIAATTFFSLVLVLPIVLGLFIVKLGQGDRYRKLLQGLGFRPIHLCPTAYDYKFYSTQAAQWVILTLDDGSTIAGLFGSKSYAASSEDGRDIYLEEVRKIKEDGAWEEVPGTAGVWICGSSIRYIEFFD